MKSRDARSAASLGTNSTVVCGYTIGRYAFIGAGSVTRMPTMRWSSAAGRLAGWICSARQTRQVAPPASASCDVWSTSD